MDLIKWLFGPKEKISKKTLNHSTIGEFNSTNRLVGGGHSQKNINELEKKNQRYHIVKTYSNGVRVGFVERHKDLRKQFGTNQTWFPKKWNDNTIKKAGQVVARGKKYKEGYVKSGFYNNVNVGIIRTNQKIATIFPMNVQKK